ncbi:peptidase C14, caspase domain-containing protein, partial [Catenaria anguillulae PL171]
MLASNQHQQGRKKALFIGINYTGTKAELRGCINDVKNISSFLFQRYGFSPDNSIILTDDQTDRNRLPTKANMVSGMKWLVKDARPGDSLFLHFSGHGASVDDKDGDEIDGKDEVLVPLDYQQVGMLLDDDINQILVKALPEGVRLVCIFDCCHSGTMLDNPFTYRVDGNLEMHCAQGKGQHRVFTALGKLREAGSSLKHGNPIGAVMGLKDTFKAALGRGNDSDPEDAAEHPAMEKTKSEKAARADVIAFSGCRDDQTSADAHISGNFTGAMSFALIKTLSENPNCTYTDLLKGMRTTLKGKYTQIPQLSAGRALELNTPFV